MKKEESNEYMHYTSYIVLSILYSSVFPAYKMMPSILYGCDEQFYVNLT